jgi:hypothetical protein
MFLGCAPLLVLCAACGDAESAEPEPRFRERTALVTPERFALVDAAADPFDDRPSEPFDCSERGYFAEDLGGAYVFAIQTGMCSYATVAQPSLEAVHAGEFLSIRLWHFALTAPNAGEAHVVVAAGDERWVDERLSIPRESALIAKTWPAARDYPSGTPIYFHVHNHGATEYLLVELSTGPDDPTPE